MLPLGPEWFLVKDETRVRRRPEVDQWALSPAGPEQVTVKCASGPLPGPDSLRDDLASTKRSRAIERDSVTPIKGPWLSGTLATWSVPEAHHAQGRFALLGQRCDVHAWGPRGTSSSEALAALVKRFGSTRPALTAELISLSAFLEEDAAARERLQWATDAGYGPIAGVVLVGDALTRLADDRLVERFQMRLELLQAAPTELCGSIVRGAHDAAPDALTYLPEARAVRWVALTREALALQARPGPPPTLPTRDDVEAAIEKMVQGDSDLAAAIVILRQPQANDGELCAAEKLRLQRVLAQPSDRRRVLLLSLVSRTR